MKASILVDTFVALTLSTACGQAESARPTKPEQAAEAAAEPAAAAQGASSVTWDDSIEQEGYRLSWAVDDDLLHVSMSAPTTGWVAVGFNSAGAMKDAQIVIGYVSAGAVSIRDDFGTAFTSHASDVSLGGTDDVANAFGSEAGGRTTIDFTIPLASGDEYDGAIVPGSSCSIIMANGSGSDSFTEIHQWAGVAEIEI